MTPEERFNAELEIYTQLAEKDAVFIEWFLCWFGGLFIAGILMEVFLIWRYERRNR